MQTYANEAKSGVLGVDEALLESDGAVSEASAKQMAENVRQKFSTDYGVSITGIAGPDGGSGDKPVGTTYIAVASKGSTQVVLRNFGRDRETNRLRASYAALELLRREILDIN
jgi:nicotinamide-nucleotide amidase